MEEITKQAAAAFLAGKNFKKSNTKVECANGVATMFLHFNPIAEYRIKDSVKNGIKIDACGWLTQTTKERLNALPGVGICQKAGVWYLNGKEWDGDTVFVNPNGDFHPVKE